MDFTRFFNEQQNYLRKVKLDFTRYLYDYIDFNEQAMMIIGQRGVGKTTLILQYLKQNFQTSQKALYVSMDNPLFSVISFYEFALDFEKIGGEILLIDEIHKLKNWSSHIKTVIDQSNLKLIITGSSMLELDIKGADLSRRVVKYYLNIMSFREFLSLNLKDNFPKYSLDEILTNHYEIAVSLTSKFKPLAYFKDYLSYGAYPFATDKISFHSKLMNVINQVLQTDIPYVCSLNYANIDKLKKLLFLLSQSVPFSLNISELARACEISRPTLIEYLKYMQSAGLIINLYNKNRGYNAILKPDKIYLSNTNLAYALSSAPNIGNLRESFFVSQISAYADGKFKNNFIMLNKSGDFIVDDKFIFEIGGAKKSFNQIKDIPNSYIVADDIEIGSGNKIPLWLFGFLY
ncbi:ATP-binding protein [Campylobacter sp. FMV-PI01]|uniref:ATP-binding protein n=1 Tax=Campylobacter portucalensis TaxID=2608384 RepID=A0A6L5WH90_9BACT|nr:AAA family ATPase [Campylobacter portucalensis]MSN96414.1 ATP-binding protein [Campylobacter portucalensis]